MRARIVSRDWRRPNPKPVAGLSAAQSRAIDGYAEEVTDALKKFITVQRRSKPRAPILSEAEKAPERGLDIVAAMFRPKTERGSSAKKPS